jgi:hypothetical protein
MDSQALNAEVYDKDGKGQAPQGRKYISESAIRVLTMEK